MRITYVTEDTDLWGGISVVFQQLELLSDAGHDAFLTTPAPKPDWYNLKVPVYRIEKLEASLIPSADIIVATSWRTIKPVVESGKGTPVHLCQGYEGDYKELADSKAFIDEVYSYRIPKLTVARHLEKLLIDRFRAETYFIGQLLDKDIFYPARDEKESGTDFSDLWKRTVSKFGTLFNKGRQYRAPFTILVVGPFDVIFKNIPSALKGVWLAKESMKLPVRLIRASQFPLSDEEVKLIRPDAYYFHVPHESMGEIYRRADLFVSTSLEAEGFGLPALEAMGCGIPTILSNISSYTSFDHPQDYALFVDPFDAKALEDSISRLFHDNSLRESLAKRGLSVAGNFTKEKVAIRLENSLTEILRGTTN
ncbi:MAG TPA: glycosyltransferase [Thermodesulfovibrionales bacterium]|nr:glycosyltransferase [Thermodesulfovibrionales bacterium]